MPSRQEVYAAIDTEREYQDSRWNSATTTSHGLHSFEEWVVYIDDYLTQLKHVLARQAKQDADREAAHILRKITTLGVAAMEQLGAPLREVSA